MLRIAIVEDEKCEIESLHSMLLQYAKESNQEFDIVTYQNPIVFLDSYKSNFDIIFMDIQMPHMDGMEAAEKLRKIDETTILIFVTNMSNMAINGYQVQAFDFIVKPVHYDSLVLKLKRVQMKLETSQTDKLVITCKGIRICLVTSEIKYIEVIDHQLIYHTIGGSYSAYGTLSGVSKQLENKGFALCKNCYLVNLRYVKSVKGQEVTVGDVELQISYPKKKSFMEALNHYIGG